MRSYLLTSAAIGLTALASAASAQDMAGSSSWTGFYVGGQLGYSWQPNDDDERINFDRNRDGTFNDAFPNFSPGFCGGEPTSRAPGTGCFQDNDISIWKLHVGYDYQFGASSGPVVGAVLEGGKAYLQNAVTAFSTTPASYTFKARLKETGALRARAGYSLSTGTLFYGTAGVAYGKIENSFTTTNAVNTFTPTKPNKSAWGLTYGGGVDQKIGKFSIGAVYLFTQLKNNDYRVAVTGGPVGGPFTVVSGTGTDFMRGRPKFSYHSLMASVGYHF